MPGEPVIWSIPITHWDSRRNLISLSKATILVTKTNIWTLVYWIPIYYYYYYYYYYFTSEFLCAKSLQFCFTLCDPMGCNLPGSSVHGILQAKILEWFAVPSSRRSSWPKGWTHVSYIYLHWQMHSFPFRPPGKLSCVCMCVCSVVSNSLWPHRLQPTRLLRPWDFPGKSTGVRCHCLLTAVA